ncbi:MAG: hypothetical protein ACRDG7_03215 [Candidatus Limnocylindria bacterium]
MTSVWREVGDRVWVRRYAALDQTIGVSRPSQRAWRSSALDWR